MTLEQQIAQTVALAIKAAVSPLLVKIAELEARAPIAGPAGPAGRDGIDGHDGAPGLNGKDGADGIAGQDGSPGLAGKDGAAGLNGKDGADGSAGKDGAPGINGKDGRDGIDGKDGATGLQGKDGAAGLAGKDGRDAVLPDLEVLAQKAAALVPAPKDGKDGVGVAGALLNKGGELILTLSDGSLHSLGVVVGEKGEPGASGKDGQNGLHGKDGVDGLGFQDFALMFDQAKGYALRFCAADGRVKDFPITIPFDAGIWEAGRVYPKGAGVTVRGAWWIAQHDTKERPEDGSGSKAWRLAVKGGRDGKPGKDGKDAES